MGIREIVNKYSSLLKEDKYDEVFSKLDTSDRQQLINFLYKNCGINALENMTTVPENIFNNAEFLTSITIPETIKSINSYAFKDSSLKEVYMSDSVTTLGSSVFENCKNLEKIRLSKSLTELPLNTFKNCSNLHRIFIPDSIEKISAGVFDGCPNDILIVANFRSDNNNKIRFPGADADFYKTHLKFKRNK